MSAAALRGWLACATLAAGCVYGNFDKVDGTSDGAGGSSGSSGEASAQGGHSGKTQTSGGNAGTANAAGTGAGQVGGGGANTEQAGRSATGNGEAGAPRGSVGGAASAGSPAVAGAFGEGAGAGGRTEGGAAGASSGGGSSDACASVTACVSGDHCCPDACNANIDSDCAPRCGNGAIESAETCDPPSSCPASCDDSDACTSDRTTGSAAQCNLACSHTPITSCVSQDGCCPSVCNANTDSDCSPRCGNSVVESGETCDPPSSCPTSCDDHNACTTDSTSGTADTCTLSCQHDLTSCACTVANGCILNVVGSATAFAGTPMVSGTPASSDDGDINTAYSVSASAPGSDSATLTTTFNLASGTRVDSIQLVASASGGGGGPNGPGSGSVSLLVEIHLLDGSVVDAYSFTNSATSASKAVNMQFAGPWLNVTSIVVQLIGGGGGQSSGGGAATLNELSIVGSGNWGL